MTCYQLKNGLCVKNESFPFFLLSIKRQTKIVGLASHDTLDDVMFLFVGFLLARSREWGFPSTRPPDALSRRRQARKLLSRLLCCHAIKKESNDRSSKSDEIPARSRHPWGLVRDTDCISPTKKLNLYFFFVRMKMLRTFSLLTEANHPAVTKRITSRSVLATSRARPNQPLRYGSIH